MLQKSQNAGSFGNSDDETRPNHMARDSTWIDQEGLFIKGAYERDCRVIEECILGVSKG